MRMRALAIVGLVLSAACARDATGPGDVAVPGIYHLVSVNGRVLPYRVAEDSTSRMDVTESVLTMNADHTWSEVTAFRLSSAASTDTASQMNMGTWSAVHGAVALTAADGSTSSGGVSGNYLTLIGFGFNLVYRR